MQYNEARQLLTDGDLVVVKTAHGIFGKLTKFFTGEYTHCGIVVWIDRGLWLVEINGGKNHVIPLSQISDVQLDVFNPPPELDVVKIRRCALESVRTKQNYGFPATVAIGLIEYFKLRLSPKWRNLIVCSGYCVKIYSEAGWYYTNLIISPTKLTTLLTKKLEIRP